MTDADKPKYQKLRDYIIETISSGKIKAGEKFYSENELAEHFEISRSTVRQAIGELVNEGWLYRVQGKGTFVYRQPLQNSDKVKTIAVVTTYLNDYIFPSIIRGIDSVLSVNSYNMLLSCTGNQYQKERLCLENLLNQNISGLIVEPTKSALPNPNIDLYKKFADLGIPVLFMHGSYRELDSSYIVEDDNEAGYLATKHLIELGHKNIGGIFKIDDIQGHYRFAGFQRAQREADLEILDSLVMWYETNDLSEKIDISNHQLENLLCQSSALVCYNDQIAVKVMDVIRKKGLKVPEDISLVSFDDSQLALASEVKLTTVAHPKEALGCEAAKSIINMIERKQDYYALKFKPELVLRNSTQQKSS
ncbi:GntR family transcriptional regulator [Clostridium thermarum]|uniref:GntR family transcriptional regulator n=1 Tax=Clostridium thermarum TaxID=1716543 RepID=UPI00111FA7BF|nr:GntR family transcriptional regulator [Clostridium thermarum]